MKKRKNCIILIFILYFLVIYFQHQFIYMYFDDYGYASLTYGEFIGKGGTNYNINDIIKYLTWHYINWGGRILPFFSEIISLKCGLWCIRIVQSLIIWGIGVCSYFLIKGGRHRDNIFKALIIVGAYFTIGMHAVVTGLFWYTACAVYVWFLLPFFLALCLYKYRKNRGYFTDIVLGILFIIAACSYEQIAVLIIIYQLMSMLVSKVVFREKWCRTEYIMLAAAIIGGMLEILAPGNYVRANSALYTDFYAQNILIRTIRNIPKVLNICIGKENAGMLLMIYATIITALSGLKTAPKTIKRCGIAISSVTSVMLIFMFMTSYHKIWYYILQLLVAIMFFICSMWWFWENKCIMHISLLMAGVGCVGILALTPVVPDRGYLPFYFVLTITIARICGEHFQEKEFALKYVAIVAALIIGIVNVSRITYGYYVNAEINRLNITILSNCGKQINNGDKISSITVYKMRDDNYPWMLPYSEDDSFMTIWLKFYYNIPQETELVWIDYKN